MKKGLVMEGGAMKGMFTCGVIDVMMENHITFDGAVGVSAGAVFGCNYKSGQIGRPIRYNKKYCKDPRYASFRSWFRTGNFYGVDFCYKELPWKLDLWDREAFEENPMEFYAVSSNLVTGQAEYHLCQKGDEDDIEWLRASASVPIVTRIVEIGDYRLFDGGVTDPIPLRFFEEKGYDRNVVITTKPKEYRDRKTPVLYLAERMIYGKYPAFIEAQKRLWKVYNETVEYIEEEEADGKILVIRPPEDLRIGGKAKDADDLERVYQIGRREGERRLEELKEYLKGEQKT